MDPHDIAATLQLLSMFKLSPEGDIMIAPDPVLLEKHMEKVRERERERGEDKFVLINNYSMQLKSFSGLKCCKFVIE